MDPEASLTVFASREAMAAQVADLVEAEMRAGVCERGRGELAVSGGSTPQSLYEALARRALDWRRIRMTLVDERWVPPAHLRSNETFVRNCFRNVPAEICGMFRNNTSPEQAARDLSAELAARDYDAVILGMGEDGHTASWFPHADGLRAALDSTHPACSIVARRSDVTGEETARVTLSLTAIQRARRIILLLAGSAKRAAYERAIEDGPVEDMPVRAILRARPDLWTCWAP